MAISSKWVFKVKYHTDGSIKEYKGRLVTQTFSQVHGIDYTKHLHPQLDKTYLGCSY